MKDLEYVESGNWLAGFPALQAIDTSLAERLLHEGDVLTLSEGHRVFGAGMTPSAFLLLLDGCVRVQHISPGGREIVLYRVEGGQSCALTTACLLGDGGYGAEAVVERQARAVAVPRDTFDELLAASSIFRRFVFSSFGRRLTDLVQVIDDAVFARVDSRLAHRLLELADESGRLSLTHQRLAAELGSAREVISRQLAEFQRRGWIESGRGTISVLEHDALQRLARSR